MFIILSTLQLLCILVFITGSNSLQCAYFASESPLVESLHTSSPVAGEGKSAIQHENCSQERSFCYAFWHYDPYDTFNPSRYRLIKAGCWNNTQDSFCDVPLCTSDYKPSRALNNTKFCCCYGNLCNSNYSIGEIDIYNENDESNLEFAPVNNYPEVNLNFVLFAVIFVIFIFTVIIVFIIICYKSIYSNSKLLNNEKAMDSLHLLESQSHPLPSVPLFAANSCSNKLEDLSFVEIIGKGKYGTVWKGKLSNLTVAIKVVTEENKRFLMNECRIYSLPFMTHSCLPQFYGYKERLSESNCVECCIAIEYGHLGSLLSYLQGHTLDWLRMCKLVRSLVQGLAYLHTEVVKDGRLKPSIAHRDLCSRNVVVKADGTCMICDFQFAVSFVNGKPPYGDGRTTALVGTLRYLAPEILEGAINLSQSETSLKQADIYSLGLILWEMASRCSDLYQGIDVPPYKMPFEQEVGQKPNFDQMKVLVSRHKARPLFPDIWKSSNPATRLLKETILECWDQEAEARLTAFCIEERACELPLLWKRYKMETLSNCCVVTSLQQLKSMQNNLHSNSTLATNNAISSKQDVCSHKTSALSSDSLDSKYPQSNCYINKFENSLHYKYNSHHHLLHHPYHNHHFYPLNSNNAKKQDLNLTVEKNMHAAARMSDKASQQPKLTLPLQPHQARNPCTERNLMLDSSDEYDGLLEQGLKFQNKSYIKSNTNSSTSESHDLQGQSGEARHSDIGGYTENRTLIRAPLPLPISYVQNPVGLTAEEASNQTVKEKDTNKYQNRSDSGELSPKMSIFEYIKHKLSLASLSKPNKACSKMLSGKQSINPLLEDDDWKESCKENIENIDAARIGTLLYSKDPSAMAHLEYTNANICSSSARISAISSSAHHGTSNLSPNSPPLISTECDLSLLQSDLLSKDAMIQLTSSSSHHCNQKSMEKINNQIDELDSFLAGSSSKIERASEDIRAEESQLLSQAP